MYFVLLKEQQRKKNQSLARKTKQPMIKGQSQKSFNHFSVLFFQLPFDPPQKCSFSLILFFSVKLCYIDRLITNRQFSFLVPRAHLSEHTCCDLTVELQLDKDWFSSSCWSPWPHKHVACILCHSLHMGGRKNFGLQI